VDPITAEHAMTKFIIHIETYRATRARLCAARDRGEDTERYQIELDALWSMMNDRDKRTILGVAEEGKRAAA
jgi:hypothetical protein